MSERFFQIVRRQKDESDGEPEGGFDPVGCLERFEQRRSEKKHKNGKVCADVYFFHRDLRSVCCAMAVPLINHLKNTRFYIKGRFRRRKSISKLKLFAPGCGLFHVKYSRLRPFEM
jgi:hypothetical protein